MDAMDPRDPPKKKHSPGEETERWSLFFADARRDVTPPPGRMPRKLCLSVCLSKKLRVVYRLMFFSIFQCISKHPLILDKSGSEELLLDV